MSAIDKKSEQKIQKQKPKAVFAKELKEWLSSSISIQSSDGGVNVSMVAAADIKASEVVCYAEPIVTYDKTNKTTEYVDMVGSLLDGKQTTNHHVWSSYQRLQPRTLEHPFIRQFGKRYFGKADWDRPGLAEKTICGGILKLKLNAFPGQTENTGLVYHTISFFNHSCSPNAVYSFDTTSNRGVITSIAPIKKGEAVTISYIDLSCSDANDKTRRQNKLREDWMFDCACHLCVSACEMKEHELRS